VPKIQWRGLPPAIKSHLKARAVQRKLSAEDLFRLYEWIRSDPDAPDGEWYKDFGSFKLCGEGQFPKTVLLPGQLATGEKL